MTVLRSKTSNGIFSWVRSLYDWVLEKSEHRLATVFLAAVAFSESVFFPVPPDVMLIPMCLGSRKKSLWYALICTTSSVVGGILGYFVGFWFFEAFGRSIIAFYGLEASFVRIQGYFIEYGIWFVITAGFTPIPYKVFTITAGLMQMALGPFVLASLIGRGGRFALVSLLIYCFGPSVRTYIDRYFNTLAVVFVVLLVGFFVVLKYL